MVRRLIWKVLRLDELEHEIDEIAFQRDSARAERDSLRARQAQWDAEQTTRLRQIETLQAELNSLKPKLREQTDADLLLVSARIIMATVRGEKPDPADVAWQQSLLNQQQSLRPSGFGGMHEGILGALGMRNIFGPH